MEGHTVHDRQPLPGWDSGLGLGDLFGQRPGNLKSQRKGLSRGVTALDEIKKKKIPLPSVRTRANRSRKRQGSPESVGLGYSLALGGCSICML